jgi:IS4 transposase
VLPALTIARIYKSRWQVELFFKWIKQHLRIKAFYGTSENAVKTRIWIGRQRLRARGRHSQAAGVGCQPLPDFTDFQRYPFRETPHFTGVSGGYLRYRPIRKS